MKKIIVYYSKYMPLHNNKLFKALNEHNIIYESVEWNTGNRKYLQISCLPTIILEVNGYFYKQYEYRNTLPDVNIIKTEIENAPENFKPAEPPKVEGDKEQYQKLTTDKDRIDFLAKKLGMV
jgi:hypothetical protein